MIGLQHNLWLGKQRLSGENVRAEFSRFCPAPDLRELLNQLSCGSLGLQELFKVHRRWYSYLGPN